MLMFAAGPTSTDAVVGNGEFHGQPVLVLTKDRIELTVLPLGGAIDDIEWRDGQLHVQDRRSGNSLTLNAALEI